MLLTVGTTCSTVVDDVEVDESLVVDVLLVLLVEMPTMDAGGRRAPIGCGNDDVGICTDVLGCVVVVVVAAAVELVTSTSELLGPIRSGMRPSVSRRPPAANVIATTPTSASTTPLDAPTIADR